MATKQPNKRSPRRGKPVDQHDDDAPAPPGGGSQGPATDASNTPVIDPTANVIALSKAEARRQDDLRDYSERVYDAQMEALESLLDERTKHHTEIIDLQVRHAADARDQLTLRLMEQNSLRADYIDKLQVAEAKRIDAIRAVDVNAVSVAAERSGAQAVVLANQVAQSADTLRALVASTASTVAAGQQALAQALGDRITKLEQAQYTGAGRALIADPQIEQLLAQMKALAQAQAATAGSKQGIGSVGQIAVGGAIVFGAVVAFYSLVSGRSIPMTVAPTQTPQIIVVPATAAPATK